MVWAAAAAAAAQCRAQATDNGAEIDYCPSAGGKHAIMREIYTG